LIKDQILRIFALTSKRWRPDLKIGLVKKASIPASTA